ncbi:hypothetical protein kac68v162_gp090 [Nodularia phage vB_NspS-kac68v162]|jgi:hypothetical protein|uniref:Uncharacterized protein n=2 Tax=Ravarandavirus kac68v161 TaxID=2845690 RepID=A0A482MK20_9CAUD|nr:hypothetical protein HWC13_gp092 [Nodularia phage vB_NspS-kac68v161]QBQ73742.1 hypothetical protein kac68v161_gp092 [Nodularia phage vB_NspS-kac68v161]QBQ73938.1 hypothetical protein kac68v162_gp090 [Nodularia phage vB_NspS-kac68v162]
MRRTAKLLGANFQKILSNKKLIIFISITSGSVSIFYVVGYMLPDFNARFGAAFSIFSTAIGLWVKSDADLSKRCRETEQVEANFNQELKTLKQDIVKSLDKVLLESNSKDDSHSKDINAALRSIDRVEVALNQHIKSAGHSDTRVALADIRAELSFLKLRQSQITDDIKTKQNLDIVTTSIRDLTAQVNSLKLQIQQITPSDSEGVSG